MNISIVITTYNANRHITETLHSLWKQTYPFYEIVIVDDGSTDDTVDIIKEFAVNHPTIKLTLYPTTHIGRAAALNQAIGLAQYEWIAIIDADDLWNAHKLELQVLYIKKFKVDFLAARTALFSNHQLPDIHQNVAMEIVSEKLINISLNQMLCSNKISHCSILGKKALLKYNQERKSQVDYEMYLRLLLQGEAIYLLDECLVYHRLHRHQSFEAKNRFRYVSNSILLQLKYCWISRKIFPAIIVMLSIGYHLFSRKKNRRYAMH